MKLKNLIAVLLLAALPGLACASPGAHGPNGEHLDGPSGQPAGGSVPRIETFTEDFELVGNLSGGELSVLIDRYATNEPVLNAKLEVQFQDMKASAKFHADMGDYAIDDARILQALAKPGKHALLFTLVAGEESDLLEGTLEVAAPAPAVRAGQLPRRWLWWAVVPLALIVVAAELLRRRRQLKTGK